jgi:hypothetical protein
LTNSSAVGREKIVKVKLLLFGEAAPIPKIPIKMGVGFISVWLDNNGYTSATNDLGSVGYILLETPEVDIGELDAERQRVFSNLHNQVVTFDIKPSLFVKSGGNAAVSMTIGVQDSGAILNRKIEFVADDCTGVSIVSKPLSFSVNMLQLDRQVAALDENTLVSDEDVVAIADAAPAEQSDEAVA